MFFADHIPVVSHERKFRNSERGEQAGVSHPQKVYESINHKRLLTLRLTLQKLQNRAARIVTNSSYDAPVDALIQKLKWPTIAEIIKRETASIVFKSINGLAPTYLSNIFSKNSSRDTVKLRNSISLISWCASLE